MPKHFKSATASIHKEKYDAFEKKCAEKGLSVHMRLKNFIEREIGESNIERTELGKTENNIKRGNQEQPATTTTETNGFLW